MQHGEPLRDLAEFRFAQAAATRIAELVLAAHEDLPTAASPWATTSTRSVR